MKFSGKVGNGPANKWFNFGGYPDYYCLDIGIVFFWFVTTGRYGKWLTDINLLFILSRMTALVRRALAEVYTVPVLLDHTILFQCQHCWQMYDILLCLLHYLFILEFMCDSDLSHELIVKHT